jgi:predicted Zn-dependent peptidase
MLISDKLSNGLNYHLYHEDWQRSVTVGVVCFAGSRDDPKGKEGLHHLSEHMPFKGTQNFPTPIELLRLVERRDGNLNAFTTLSKTVYHLTLPPSDINSCLKVIAELVFRPLLREEDWLTEKRVILNEIQRSKNDTDQIFSDLRRRSIFSGTNLEHHVLGDEESVNGIDILDIRKMYAEDYNLENCNLIVVGNLPSNIRELVSKEFAEVPIPHGKNLRVQQPVPSTLGEQYVFENSRFHTARMNLNWISKVHNHRQFRLLDLFVEMTGYGCLGSPLLQEIREKLGLVYHLDFGVTRSLPGLDEAGFVCDTEYRNVPKIVEAFWSVFDCVIRDKDQFEFGRDRVIAQDQMRRSKSLRRFMEIARSLEHDTWIEDSDWDEIAKSLRFEELLEVVNPFFERDKTLTFVVKNPSD